MGTEVLRPQDFLPKVAPVIVWKNSIPSSPKNNNTLRKPQQPLVRRFLERTGSTPRRERELKPNHHDIINGDDSYAGSGFFHSPSPKSLPLPSFFNKKQESIAMAADHDGFDDSATRHLRQLLRLG